MVASGTGIVSKDAALTESEAGTTAGDRPTHLHRNDANGAMDYRERLEFALGATGTGIWTFDESEGALHFDRRVMAQIGVDREVMPLDEFLAALAPDHAGMFAALLQRPPEPPSSQGDLEIRVRRFDNAVERWIAVRSMRVGSAASREVVGTARDITDLRQHDAQVHMLMREVTHRSKNLLAIIQAMARQTVKDSLTAVDFELRFSSRLRGLSFSHELLAAQDWRGAALGDLAKGHLQTVLEQHGDRVTIAGPAVFIRPEAAQNIGLALNELTSNALKFGALSDQNGKVSLEWSIDADSAGPRWLHIVWNEYGERPILPPSRQGFGHKVMERVVARALDGTATMTFAPTGLQWSLRVPISHLVLQAEEQDVR